MNVIEVHQGRLESPFYPRLKALDRLDTWHTWKGYTTPDALFDAELKQQGHQEERGGDQEKTETDEQTSEIKRLRTGRESLFANRKKGEPDVRGTECLQQL